MPKIRPMTKAPDEFREEAFQIIQSDDAFCGAASGYITYILTPPLLARRLRARGDESARAGDFECPCLTACDTDRPRCQIIFADCRFAKDPDREKSPGLSPRAVLFESFLIDLAFAYRNAPPQAKVDMLAFMNTAADKQFRRILRRREPGKILLDAIKALRECPPQAPAASNAAP